VYLWDGLQKQICVHWQIRWKLKVILTPARMQTVEMRSPDGSADLYQLLAGLAVACRHGF
jgi:glutamine synthetase